MFQRGTVYFENRRQAGQKLGDELTNYTGQYVVVLGIPRGGVPVVEPIARRLDAELDVIVVKKLGAPQNPELAIGAVGESGEPYLNEDVIASLSVDEDYLTKETRGQHDRVKELASEFRSVQDKYPLHDRPVILVDDGIATGATVRACLNLIVQEDPRTIVLAVPVAPARTVQEFREEELTDRVVCLREVKGGFGGIGGYYRDFSQVSTEEVRDILREHSSEGTNQT